MKYDGMSNGYRKTANLPMSAAERTAQPGVAQECREQEWANNPRWKGVERPYAAADVLRLRGSIHVEHTLARLGAERLWELLQTESYVIALGAVTLLHICGLVWVGAFA